MNKNQVLQLLVYQSLRQKCSSLQRAHSRLYMEKPTHNSINVVRSHHYVKRLLLSKYQENKISGIYYSNDLKK